jgi:hypothetical protein
MRSWPCSPLTESRACYGRSPRPAGGRAWQEPYPTDVKDDEWKFVAPYLALIREDAPPREHDLREIYNALRWIVRSGAP